MGEKVGDGWGINADYITHCETEAGDSLLGLVTKSVKYCVNTQDILCFCVHTLVCQCIYEIFLNT